MLDGARCPGDLFIMRSLPALLGIARYAGFLAALPPMDNPVGSPAWSPAPGIKDTYREEPGAALCVVEIARDLVERLGLRLAVALPVALPVHLDGVPLPVPEDRQPGAPRPRPYSRSTRPPPVHDALEEAIRIRCGPASR